VETGGKLPLTHSKCASIMATRRLRLATQSKYIRQSRQNYRSVVCHRRQRLCRC